MTPKRTSKYNFLKFTRLREDPRNLARDTAIGTFSGIVPIIPLKTILVLLVTFITGTSTIAALLATVVVCNPLTYVAQYYFSIVIGNTIMPYHFDWERMKGVLDILLTKPELTVAFQDLAELRIEAAIILIVGGTIMALPFALTSYFFSQRFFLNLREKKRKNHTLGNEV